MPLFKGAGVALVTPFDKDKNISFGELETLLEFQVENGTDAIIVCGTTGEPATMTMKERLAVIDFTVEKIAGRIPVIAGTGCNCTDTVVEYSMEAKEIGVDGLLIVTPYYNKATQNGLYWHYKTIADAVTLPIIMYNVPSRTGVNLLPQTAARLGKECLNIVAVKEASGNISQVADLIHQAEGSLDVYSGNDDEIIPVLSLGGIGVISVLSNVAPRDTHDMVMEYLEGSQYKAVELQLKYMDLIHALFCEVNPIPVKKALQLMGFEAGVPRLPLTELEEGHIACLVNELKRCNLRIAE